MTEGELHILETLIRQHREMAEILSSNSKRIRALEASNKALSARIRDVEQRFTTTDTIRE